MDRFPIELFKKTNNEVIEKKRALLIEYLNGVFAGNKSKVQHLRKEIDKPIQCFEVGGFKIYFG